MNREVKVKPGSLTPFMAGLSIVILTLFLVFGAGGLLFAWQDVSDSEPGLGLVLLGFCAIWVVACGGLIRLNIRMWKISRSGESDSIMEIVENVEPDGPRPQGVDFEARLRQLEALNKDGLLTEEEYQRKRAEILGETW